MKKPFLFSIIIATYGRYLELDDFLSSVTEQTINISTIEIIIVDQNDSLDLKPIIEKYRTLHIIHLKSYKKGLSYNRNLGLAIAKGEIVAFPDDDCKYYSNTLESVLEILNQNQKVTLVLGRIIDRTSGKLIIRNWPHEAKPISKLNFLMNSSSITLFSKWRASFDERLGAGTYFGSCEDLDFIFNYLLKHNIASYNPIIEVWHPEQLIEAIEDAKIIRYGLGFGALARKHWSWVFAYLFAGVIAFHMFGLFKALLRQDNLEVRKRWLSVTSRFRGLIEFSDKL